MCPRSVKPKNNQGSTGKSSIPPITSLECASQKAGLTVQSASIPAPIDQYCCDMFETEED